MNAPSPCDSFRLDAVLEHRHDDPHFEDTVKHLSDCLSCQTQLDELAAGRWWWTSGRELVQSSASIACEMSSSASTSQVVAIASDEQAFSASVNAASTFDFEKWSVDFLHPPSHPECLGRLGKYEIERVVGHGGMGVVFKGFDSELNRAVAIKVLAPHLASNGTARQRFAREAKAAAAVVHDHVIAIYGIDTSGKLPYLVMPFIGGDSLHSYIHKQGPLKTKDIVRIAMQIAAGLAAAHEQGLVHRDVKPANIMLENGFGRVLITDFGLARAADDASITRTGLVAGTPHYMSPEQANGEAVDHRSDLFSLGSLIYFMATGGPPFRAEGAMAVLNAICHRQPQDIREANSEIPQPVAQIVARLHQKKPTDRFDSATKLRILLADYLAHLQNPLRIALPHSLRRQRSRRHLLGLVLAICAAWAAFVFWPSGTTTSNADISQAAPVQSKQNNDFGPEVLTSTLANSAGSDHLDAAINTLEAQVNELEQEFQSTTTIQTNRGLDAQIDELESATRFLERSIRADLSTEN